MFDCTCNTQNSLFLNQHNGNDAPQDSSYKDRTFWRNGPTDGTQNAETNGKRATRAKDTKRNARTSTATTTLTKQVTRNNILGAKRQQTQQNPTRREANSSCKTDKSTCTFSHKWCRVISLFAPCPSRQERRNENKWRGEERRIKQTAVTLSGRNPPGAPAGHQTGLGMRGHGDSRHCYKHCHSEGD